MSFVPAASLPRLACALTLLASASAQAFDVERLETGTDGERYTVTLEAVLQAPAPAVLSVLRDFAGYPRLDARILESRVLESNGSDTLLYTRIRGCVGSVFCRTMARVEWVKATEQGLEATVVPARSDVRYGLTVVQVSADGAATRVVYALKMEPKFWMPRWLVGPLIQRTLREGTLSMFDNVERAAAPRAEALTAR
jgi:hypothetical protein